MCMQNVRKFRLTFCNSFMDKDEARITNIEKKKINYSLFFTQNVFGI
jgi:hypothetical protein